MHVSESRDARARTQPPTHTLTYTQVPEALSEFYLETYPDIPEPEPADGGDGKKDKKKDKKEKGGKKKGKKKGKEPPPPEEPPGLTDRNEMTNAMQDQVTAFNQTWKDKDEAHNVAQKHDVEHAKAKLRVEVDAELRVAVDQMLLENLAKIKLQLFPAGKGKKRKGGKNGKKKGGESERAVLGCWGVVGVGHVDLARGKGGGWRRKRKTRIEMTVKGRTCRR